MVKCETPESYKEAIKRSPILSFTGKRGAFNQGAVYKALANDILTIIDDEKRNQGIRTFVNEINHHNSSPSIAATSINKKEIKIWDEIFSERILLRDRLIIVFNARKLQSATGLTLEKIDTTFDWSTSTAIFATDEYPRFHDYTLHSDPLSFSTESGFRKRHSNAFDFSYTIGAINLMLSEIVEHRRRVGGDPDGEELKKLFQRCLETVEQEAEEFQDLIKRGKVKYDESVKRWKRLD